MSTRAGIIADLKKGLSASPAPRRRALALGVPEIDAALAGGGLRLGALHEICGPAATGFALALAGTLTGEVLWCAGHHERGTLYPPGLARFGIATHAFTLVRTRRRHDALWAAEEALRCGACACVVLEAGFAIGMTESRRLQLAAEAGGNLALVLRPGAGQASVARTRWRAAPCPGPTPVTDERWRLELLRDRGGATGAWEVVWHATSRRLHAATRPAELPLDAPAGAA